MLCLARLRAGGTSLPAHPLRLHFFMLHLNSEKPFGFGATEVCAMLQKLAVPQREV